MARALKIVTLGGGGGHSQVLRGLASAPHRITAVCTAADSGGSTGQLAKKFGKYGVNGSIGDASRCCCALSADPKLSHELTFRFPSRDLAQMSLKNLLLAGLIIQYGAQIGLQRFHKIIGVPSRHRVLPVSFERTNLHVKFQGGQVLSGEAFIDTVSRNQLWNPHYHKIADIWLKPAIDALPEVMDAIRDADVILVTPGDLFTSCIPVLLADGMARAVKKSSAKLVYLLSLMTKLGETDGYQASDFVRELAKRTCGRMPDVVVANHNGIPANLLRQYRRKEHKVAVVTDKLTQHEFKDVRLVRADLWSSTHEGHIVHDPQKTARTLAKVFRTL